jgi:hypothetical protein
MKKFAIAVILLLIVGTTFAAQRAVLGELMGYYG